MTPLVLATSVGSARVHLRLADDDPVAWLLEEAQRRTGRDCVLSRRCPRCGSTDHGRPELRDPDGQRVPGTVSLARSREHGVSLAAWTAEAAGLGVDLEVAGRPFPEYDDVARHPHEPPAGGGALRQWVRKEAALKALGTGLALDPRAVLLGPAEAAPVIQAWPGPAVGLVDLDLPGWVAAVAMIGSPGEGSGPAVTQEAGATEPTTTTG